MVGYFLNRPGVTMLTRLSVHWAERMVATSSSQGLEWCRAQVTPGYISSNVARIFLMRAARSAAVLGFRTLVKVDIPLGRRLVRILFGELQHLVELLAEDVVMHFVIRDRFLEGILAALGF